MKKQRLDQAMVQRGLATTRSQAENYIKLGYVLVDGKSVNKAGQSVSSDSQIKLILKEQYVSRAALKLASVSEKFKLNFKDKTVLDVGSSTGGFTDFALRHGAKKVVAVEVGANQMHPSLRDNPKIELHERTDIRNFKLKSAPDIVLVDVSFISLSEVLPHIAGLSSKKTQIVALLKPQFEAGKEALNKGVVKNDRLRRQVLRNFELWSKKLFVIRDKADSAIAGEHGNVERFYLLKLSTYLISREEQPERRIHSAPGAMRNPEGVSYKALAVFLCYNMYAVVRPVRTYVSQGVCPMATPT